MKYQRENQEQITEQWEEEGKVNSNARKQKRVKKMLLQTESNKGVCEEKGKRNKELEQKNLTELLESSRR